MLLTLSRPKTFFSGSPEGRTRVLNFFVISKVSTIVDIGTAPGLLSLVVDFCRHWPSAQSSTRVDLRYVNGPLQPHCTAWAPGRTVRL